MNLDIAFLKRAIKVNHRKIIFLFFASYFLIGILAFRGYGVHWDQHYNRKLGLETWNYVFRGRSSAFLKVDPSHLKSHGPAFEFLLIFVEKIFKLTDDRDITLERHFMTFLLFYIGVIFFYFLCRKHFDNRSVALMGALLLILTPRIFAHSFYNTVDIAFLVLFIMSVYTLIVLMEKMGPGNAFLHAMTSACLISIRNVGILVPIFTYLYALYYILRLRREFSALKKIGMTMGLYTLFLIPLVYLLWPYLWEDPVRRFADSIFTSAKINWQATVLYLGEYIKGTDIPWHYNFVWMAITIPLFYMFCFFIGLIASVGRVWRIGSLSLFGERTVIFLLWLFIPLLAPILFGTTLFDGWRHHFFTYPAFLIISLSGLQYLYRQAEKMRRNIGSRLPVILLVLVTIASLSETAWFMKRYAPHQYAYFNRLAGRDIRARFDLDYWGLSYRQALEYILAKDPSEDIPVFITNPAGKFNVSSLRAGDRKRIRVVYQLRKANYFIGNFRWHKENYPFSKEFYSIKVKGEKIVVVYRLR